jgi:hypothetical protein
LRSHREQSPRSAVAVKKLATLWQSVTSLRVITRTSDGHTHETLPLQILQKG